MANDPTVRHGRLPPGYFFVPKGNVFLTGTCRKQTQAGHQTVYLVVNPKATPIGIAVPLAIHQAVQQRERATRATRAAHVDRRDRALKTSFGQAIRHEFPHLPPGVLPRVLASSLQKGAGKVGRTAQLGPRDKAHKAVRAHIRHCHTDYEQLLRGAPRGGRAGEKARRAARKKIQSQVNTLAATWMGRPPPTMSSLRQPVPSSSSSSSPGKGKSSAASQASVTAKPKQPRALKVAKKPALVPRRNRVLASTSTTSTSNLLRATRASHLLKPFELIDLTMESSDDDDDDHDSEDATGQDGTDEDDEYDDNDDPFEPDNWGAQPSTRREFSKRHASNEAGRRLSQYFHGASRTRGSGARLGTT